MSTAASTAPFTLTPSTRIGWIGVGVMGKSMVSHILRSGRSVNVYSRTLSKCSDLPSGAVLCSSVEQLARSSDVVFAIVSMPNDVREVFLGQNGLVANMAPGSAVVDMTTSSPELAREIATAASAKRISSLDAPVSGGDIGAREARLSIMVGGADKNVLEALLPIFNVMGKNITHCGGPGAGQHTKMVNQILIANGMIGVCEGLLYAQRAGLDPLTVIQAVSAGAAGSWSISNLGPKIVARNFEPGFYVEHFIKDLGIALAEANRMGLALPGLALAQQLYVSTQALGYGRKASTALHLALEAMNGISLPQKQ